MVEVSSGILSMSFKKENSLNIISAFISGMNLLSVTNNGLYLFHFIPKRASKTQFDTNSQAAKQL